MGEKTENQFEPKLKLLDRRAGRETEGLRDISKSISEINIEGVKVKLFKSVAHRCGVMISSAGVSPNVSDSNVQVGSIVPDIDNLDEYPKSVRMASVLNKWQNQTYKIMRDHEQNNHRKFPANYILLRGASSYRTEKSFEEKFGMKGAVIAGSPAVRGIGKHLEMDVINVVGATADLQTDLKNKTLAALEALRDHEFVLVNILGADVAAHDKDVRKKAEYSEKIDREVFERLKEYVDFSKTILIVTSDHVTDPETGRHESGSFPFMIYTSDITSNSIEKYSEQACKLGPMLHLSDVMEQLMRFL